MKSAPQCTPQVSSSTRPRHPALDLDPLTGVASVGVIDPFGGLSLLVRAPDGTLSYFDPYKLYKDRLVRPAPLSFAQLAGRWNAPEVLQAMSDAEVRDLFGSVRTTVTDYIEFRRAEEASLVTCWIIGTYVYTLFPAYPRLNIYGEARCGKSKLLDVVRRLGFNGLLFVYPSLATIFRLIEPLRPTLCLDEMENLGRDRTDLTAILNNGYKSGGCVPRVEEDAQRRREVRAYDVYAPVAFAGVKGVNPVTASRCLRILLERSHDRAKVNREIDSRDAPRFQRGRDSLYRFALTNFMAVEEARTTLEAPDWLMGRARELYAPMLAVAEVAARAGDDSFRADVLRLAQRDCASEEGVTSADGRALFAELERRLREARTPSVEVYPSELVPVLSEAREVDHLSAEEAGHVLQRYGFPRDDKRTRRGSKYTITRELFAERADRYSHDFEPFTDSAALLSEGTEEPADDCLV